MLKSTFLFIFFTLIGVSSLGQTIHNAVRLKQSFSIPKQIVGDWLGVDKEVRFNQDGYFSWIITEQYSITNNNVLQFRNETYERRSGTTGLNGTWRTTLSGGEWLDLTFARYNFYAFEWNDGLIGGGYYSVNHNELTLIERRGSFSCSENTITFIYLDGNPYVAEFSIVGDTLTIKFPSQTDVYTRIHF